MSYSGLRELVTHREPSLPGPYDNDSISLVHEAGVSSVTGIRRCTARFR